MPELNSVQVTHLLWADDLVLLALDPESLQSMLNVLFTYCGEWGLTVNTDKTAVVVFNRSGRQLKDSLTFKFGGTEIPSAREYCYLGVSFSLNGTLRPAQVKLRQKGLRSYFALKRMLDLRGLRKSILFRLFDALILPVAAYGSQVWLPDTEAFRQMAASLNGINGDQNKSAVDNTSTCLSNIATDPIERLHLSFLKWTMGVNKYTSNAAVWGDTGRHPVALVFTYLYRVQQMDTDDSPAYYDMPLTNRKTSNLIGFLNSKL